MTSPAADALPQSPKKYKMKLLRQEFNIDFGGRLPAGAVVLVDEATAIRWYEHGVAEIAEPGTETYAEHSRRVKRDEFLKRAKPAEGVFDQAISRQAFDGNGQMLREMPKPPRGRRTAGDPLKDAPVVSDPGEDDE